jgi:hypothetical protein
MVGIAQMMVFQVTMQGKSVLLRLLNAEHFRVDSFESTDCNCGHLAPDSFLFPAGALCLRTVDFKFFFLLHYHGKH